MFLLLLFLNFVIALVTATILAVVFWRPMKKIMARLIDENIYVAWVKYMIFAIYVVGISGGVNIFQLERYIQGDTIRDATGELVTQQALEITSDTIALEVYRTIIQTLQSVAWVLLVFFLVALIGYLIVRGREVRGGSKRSSSKKKSEKK